MKKIALTLCSLFVISPGLRASPTLDHTYALRTIVVAVINGETDPVYAEHVENQLIRYIKKHSRFDFPNHAFISFKNDLRSIYTVDPSVATRDKLGWIKTPI